MVYGVPDQEKIKTQSEVKKATIYHICTVFYNSPFSISHHISSSFYYIYRFPLTTLSTSKLYIISMEDQSSMPLLVLESETELEWPPASPDLNPIECVWRTMKDRLDDLPVRPSTIPDMIRELEKMWNNLNPQVSIHSFVLFSTTNLKS